MRNHVPYIRKAEPVYIGFEQAKPRRNGLGKAGLRMSILGLLSAGFLAPLALPLCLLGMVRAPRAHAFFGTIFSLAGIGMMVTVIGLLSQHHEQHSHTKYYQTNHAIVNLNKQITEAVGENDGKILEGVAGNRVALMHRDAWGNELRYEVGEKENSYGIRSVGPDGEYATRDDIYRSFNVRTVIESKEMPAESVNGPAVTEINVSAN